MTRLTVNIISFRYTITRFSEHVKIFPMYTHRVSVDVPRLPVDIHRFPVNVNRFPEDVTKFPVNKFKKQ